LTKFHNEKKRFKRNSFETAKKTNYRRYEDLDGTIIIKCYTTLKAQTLLQAPPSLTLKTLHFVYRAHWSNFILPQNKTQLFSLHNINLLVYVMHTHCLSF
jgi:hypothetical protein